MPRKVESERCAKAFGPQPFDREKHIYRCNEFSELLKDAVRFFHGTPVCQFPPEERFNGAGVYALYYIGKSGLYAKFGREINREEYRLPIYVGKAVPMGWRQSRNALENGEGAKLFERLKQHANSVRAGKGLNIDDFVCRLMIFEGPVQAMIASVEAALIAMHRPLWNSVIDGFGNHNPGNKRFSGMITQWDSLHPGRAWTNQMTGKKPDVKMLNRRVKDYFAGLR